MTTVKVMHVKDVPAKNGRSLLSEIGWGSEAIDFPKNHDLVAEVETKSSGMKALDEAYKLTQNILGPWPLNPGVRPYVDLARSTHIGDVLVIDGAAFVCAVVGWEKVASADQRVVRG